MQPCDIIVKDQDILGGTPDLPRHTRPVFRPDWITWKRQTLDEFLDDSRLYQGTLRLKRSNCDNRSLLADWDEGPA